MCNPVLAALFGLAASCGAPHAMASPPEPDDPRLATAFRPPASPTADLKTYMPADARKDWGEPPSKPSGGSSPGGGMPATGMKDMPGMGGR